MRVRETGVDWVSLSAPNRNPWAYMPIVDGKRQCSAYERIDEDAREALRETRA